MGGGKYYYKGNQSQAVETRVTCFEVLDGKPGGSITETGGRYGWGKRELSWTAGNKAVNEKLFVVNPIFINDNKQNNSVNTYIFKCKKNSPHFLLWCHSW